MTDTVLAKPTAAGFAVRSLDPGPCACDPAELGRVLIDRLDADLTGRPGSARVGGGDVVRAGPCRRTHVRLVGRRLGGRVRVAGVGGRASTCEIGAERGTKGNRCGKAPI